MVYAILIQRSVRLTIKHGLLFVVDFSIMTQFARVTLTIAVLVLVFHSFYVRASENERIIVKTALGEIAGVTLKSRLGRDYYAFRGIRYAMAPTGKLRFQAPQPIDPWTDIYDATDDGPQCPQPQISNTIVESEDCLMLNIYSEKDSWNATFPDENLKPVLFYIHPGGFYSSSGVNRLVTAEYLMDRDIVLVTINYRLGSLGFLSTGTKDCPGNAGLKDQVEALKFVRNYISFFGGNPNSITLLGYSAGALSITLHMVSPMTRGLFHRAIVMSASAVGQWSPPLDQLELAEKQAQLFNCTTTTTSELVQCLQNVDALEMGRRLGEMFEWGSGNPVLLWKPVIEQNFGQERFLTEDPTISYLEGRSMRIPVITGITKDEFVNLAYWVLNNDTLKYEFDAKFNDLAPICFLYERNTVKSKEISQILRKKYVNFPLISKSKLPQLGEKAGRAIIIKFVK